MADVIIGLILPMRQLNINVLSKFTELSPGNCKDCESLCDDTPKATRATTSDYSQL